jgi:hypothetical protein
VPFKWWKEIFLVRSRGRWCCAGVLLPTVTICLHQLVQELVGVRERKNDELLTNNRAPHAALNTDYQT